MCKFIVFISLIYLTLFYTTAASSNNHAQTEDVPLNLDALLQRTSFLYGLSTISNEHLVESSSCDAELRQFRNGFTNKLPWAMKMYDASAGFETGFTFGHNYWLGTRAICDATQQPVRMKLSSNLPHRFNRGLMHSLSPFPTDFRVIYLRQNSTWQVDTHVEKPFGTRVHVGLCLPSSCTERDVQHLTNTYLAANLFAGNELYEMNLEYDYAKDFKMDANAFKGTSFYIYAGAMLITIGLIVAAACLRREEAGLQQSNGTATAHATKSSKSIEATVAAAADKHASSSTADKTVTVNQGKSWLTSLIACFDWNENWQQLFKPSPAHSTFVALNGLRFASAVAVTFYHYLVFLVIGAKNRVTIFNDIQDLGNMNIFVDVFFTISGFLQSYNHFRHPKIIALIRQNSFTQNAKFIAMHVFHRYLRLAPLYFLLVAASDFGGKLTNDFTFFHIGVDLQGNCQNYWWRNLFFIQNLFHHLDMCGLWTWSLACDMQFAVLATVLLFTYVKHPRFTKSCLVAIVIANILYTYTFGIKVNYDLTVESSLTHMTEIYANPLSRVLPYMCGCVAGWIFVEQRSVPLLLGKSAKNFAGFFVALIFFGLIFMPKFENVSPFTAITILILERIAFTLASSILILANGLGQMRWFFGIFESSAFQKFHKLAYAMFLLNPWPVLLMMGLSESGFYLNRFIILVECIGIVVILVAYCVLMTLLFVSPYQNISRLLITRKSQKKVL